MNTTIEIRPHPAGGLTLAVPVPGTATAREYVGRYPSREDAEAALAEWLADNNSGVRYGR